MTKSFLKYRPHPWHGLEPGPNPPSEITVFVEITPFDHIKYEIDKHSGFLRVDRPQYSSSRPPSVYGFIPRTLAADTVSRLMEGSERGDADPLDVCVLASQSINHPGVLLTARVIGGIPMLDQGEADDKIIAVLSGDGSWGDVTDVNQLPTAAVEQLRHYFSTYKLMFRAEKSVSLGPIYGREHAETVVAASISDYQKAYGDVEGA